MSYQLLFLEYADKSRVDVVVNGITCGWIMPGKDDGKTNITAGIVLDGDDSVKAFETSTVQKAKDWITKRVVEHYKNRPDSNYVPNMPFM